MTPEAAREAWQRMTPEERLAMAKAAPKVLNVERDGYPGVAVVDSDGDQLTCTRRFGGWWRYHDLTRWVDAESEADAEAKLFEALLAAGYVLDGES